MGYWNSPDGIVETALEFSRPETGICECGCRERFLLDDTFRHATTGERIAIQHEEHYDELIEKERIENE